MTTFVLLTSVLLLSASADSALASDTLAAPAHLRCGWFDNPSPGNASLSDRDGEWTVAMQGEFQAKGKWPTFKRSQWVRTGNGNAGYGCACLKVRDDVDARNITEVLSAQAKPLAVCRRDKALTEPLNPLK